MKLIVLGTGTSIPLSYRASPSLLIIIEDSRILFVTRYPPILEKREKFVITGPCGLRDFLNRLRKAYGRWLDIPSEMLNHFYPEVLKTDIAGACRKTYNGELILGRDLLHISLRY